MRHARWAVSLGWLAAALSATTAAAQDNELRRIHVMPYAGMFVFNDSDLTDATGVEVDPGAILGVRGGYAFARSWQVEAAYGYAPLSTETSEFQEGEPGVPTGDLTAHLFYGAVDYLLEYEDNPTKLLLAAGLGFMILDPEGEGADSEGGFMLELGVGFTHPMRDWITIRGEARDHMVFCSAAEGVGDSSACPFEDDLLHHFELSAGVQFWIY